MKAPLRVIPALLLILVTASAHACTVCDSENGRALRAGLFNGTFLHTFLLVMAPAPILMAAVAILHLAMPDLPTSEPNPEPGFSTPCEAVT